MKERERARERAAFSLMMLYVKWQNMIPVWLYVFYEMFQSKDMDFNFKTRYNINRIVPEYLLTSACNMFTSHHQH